MKSEIDPLLKYYFTHGQQIIITAPSALVYR